LLTRRFFGAGFLARVLAAALPRRGVFSLVALRASVPPNVWISASGLSKNRGWPEFRQPYWRV